MRRLSFVLGLMLLVGCARNPLQPGDLLFQAGEGGMPMAMAIESATGGVFSHVGILGESLKDVWEAVPEEGVRNVPLQQFLEEASLDAVGKPYVRVYRAPCDWEDVLARLKALKGRPYDKAFLPGDDALYCSELVYECYRDSTGKPLFSTIPMTFKGEDGVMVPYWVSHYAELGVAIPEGEPGTNPNDLSRSLLLTPVPVKW
jgi:hypothetical protein